LKKYIPFIVGGLGIAFIVISLVLRNGTPDADVAITNVASTFMLVAGGICIVVGLVSYFLRHDHEIW
jgi:hypothetical protein